MIKKLLCLIITRLYKVKISGLENYYQAGNRALIIANHLSFLDAILLALFLPQDQKSQTIFAVNSFIAKKWWMRPFLLLAKTFALDPTNPMAVKSLINEIKKDKK